MVNVVDAIMGTGKSSAAIEYINAHPDQKFIYISPYKDEAARISKACPGLQFYEPQKKSQYKGSKVLHTVDLVSQGANVATTHQAFKLYPKELIDMIRDKGYTLIVDESVDILDDVEEDTGDIQMAIDAGYISKVGDGVYRLTNDVYGGGKHNKLFRVLRSRDVVKIKTEKGNREGEEFYYWILPPELFTAFSEVFVLTYMFEGQHLHHMFELYKIPYRYIGISHPDEKTYRFCEGSSYRPAYLDGLKDMIHIYDHPRLNSMSDDAYDFTKKRLSGSKTVREAAKNNLYNYFHNLNRRTPDRFMWSTFEAVQKQLSGKGYTGAFVAMNERATNKYRGRDILAYYANVYMNVGQADFYAHNGIKIDNDMFALSMMVQWIWRSAIRDGKEIQVYIPSKRMRNLLKKWIDDVSRGEQNVAS